jgi:hypothetical protein
VKLEPDLYIVGIDTIQVPVVHFKSFRLFDFRVQIEIECVAITRDVVPEYGSWVAGENCWVWKENASAFPDLDLNLIGSTFGYPNHDAPQSFAALYESELYAWLPTRLIRLASDILYDIDNHCKGPPLK